jgi:hypothetical protein
VAEVERILGEAHWKRSDGLADFAKSEEILIRSVATMNQAHDRRGLDVPECIRALIDLYAAWHAAEPGKGYDAKAAEWRKTLDAASAPADDAGKAGTS